MSKTFESIEWAGRLRVFGVAGACMLAACSGEIERPASPLVDNTQLHLTDIEDTTGTTDTSTEERSLPGFTNRVTIQRDGNGAPHIKARSEQEGYGALCYAMAQDRLFQLDLLRHNVQGRVSELFGPGDDGSVLQGDRLSRVINIPKLAADRLASMSQSSQNLMQACSTGINDFIDEATAKGALPLEFGLLQHAPERWQPADSLAITMGVAMNLDTGIYLTKLQYTAIANLVSGDIAAALIPPPPALSMFDAKGKLNPPSQYISAPGRGSGRRPMEVLTTMRRGDWHPPQRRSTGLGEGTGPESNNYAIDGQLASTGHPLVANDPHLPLTTPSLAYAAQLTVERDETGKRLNVEGITFPGFPLFVSGRTAATSWAITFMLLDDVDLYIENIRDAAAGGKEVLINGSWVPVNIRNEVIDTGAGTETIQVLETPHGPVLNAAFDSLPPYLQVALKSTIAQREWSIEGLINLPRTSNWAQFQTSARSSSIGLNFLFSDETGNKGRIGYQASGLVPLRSADNGFAAVDGSDGEHEWTGFAKPEELPSAYNPPAHVLATGNNRIVPDDYNPKGRPIYISNYYDTPWRAQRLYTRLLKNSGAFSANSFASIQLDTYSVVNPPLRDTFVSAIKRVGVPQDALTKAAFDALQKWDGNADANSSGAAVYETLLFVLMGDTALGALVDPDLYAAYASSVFVTQQQQALRDLLESPRAPFFGAGPGDNAASKRDQAVSAALTKSVALLSAALGTDASKWTWGGVHTLTYNHPLAGLDPRFDIGSFPAKGDAATPLIGGFFLHAGLLALPTDQVAEAGGVTAALSQDALQVVRAIWEPSSRSRSLVTLSTGESGDPRTRHFADQAKAWREGKYLQMPFAQ